MEGYIRFEEDRHQYFDPEDNEYTSVSRVLGGIKPEFDKERIAAAVAKRDGRTRGDVLAEWDAKRDSAAEWGTKVHNALEVWFRDGVLQIEDPKFQETVGWLSSTIFSGYHMTMEEKLMFSRAHHVAGTADKVCFRQRSKNTLVDYYDYKTNESKGITFDSTGIDKRSAKTKHYNRFLQNPVGHMEDCNYNIYALQLSIYAFLGEIEYNWKPGRLGIVFIDKHFDCTILPVPYLRDEAKAILSPYALKAKSVKSDDNSWDEALNGF